jgi:N-acetylglucosamine malate deacetylase 1
MGKKVDIDIIAFSPHPDDAEMGCGGLLLKLKDKGYNTGIIDITMAELSTNGDFKTRAKEMLEASRILKLDLRENLELEDANIKNDYESRLKVIEVIRKYRPKMVLIPYFIDRHPDHENSYKLLKDAIFISGLAKFKNGMESYRPRIVLNYMLHYEFKPSFIVDISEYYDNKFEAVSAYKSQFYSDAKKKAMTYVASKYFFDIINSRHRCLGLKIMAEFGEAYHIDATVKIDDPVKYFDYLF